MAWLEKLRLFLRGLRRFPQAGDFVVIIGVILLLGFIASYFLSRMDSVMAVAVVLLFGLVMGELVQWLKVPKVTGYLVAGILIGPSVLGLMTAEMVGNVRVISEITLGLIILAIGAEFELKHFISVGPKVIYLALAEVLGAFLLVGSAMLLFGLPLPVALLIGAIATATAPAATLMVVREYRSRGRLTDLLLAVVALNNILCLMLFHTVFAFTKMSVAARAQPLDLAARAGYLFEPVWMIFGSLLFGMLVGYALNLWEQATKSDHEQLMVVLGGVLFSVGAAATFHLSPLLTTMAVGATVVNISAKGKKVLDILRLTDPPFYVAFFVISGAMLHLDLLAKIGLVGLAYLFARALGKAAGAYCGARLNAEAAPVQKFLGLSLIPQAGVAIGVAMAVEAKLPEIGAVVITIVLSSVIIYELVGPYLTKLALALAGEIPKKYLDNAPAA
ncbi:MAG: cation:proton antiporter [Candidatus Saganbacteria bacterium]|nr:cation:proton antiporter [Candidatus Saganbacteria bacterium]